MSTTRAASAFHQNNSKTLNQQPDGINQDEAEAGSILVALANHNNVKQNTKSMSIHHLLGSNGSENQKRKMNTEFTERHRAVSQDNGKRLRESADEQCPATPPPTHYSYKHEQQQSYNKMIRERMYSSPEAYNMQHQQPNAYLTHPPHMAKGKNTAEGFVHSHPNHSHYNKHNLKEQQQQHHHQQLNRHRHPPVYTPSPSTNDFSKQYAHMKQNPKIRRNAPQVYISYMTYTDMMRKMKKQGPVVMQQHKKPKLPPASRYITAPPANYQQQQLLVSPPYPQQRYHPANSMISPPPPVQATQHHPYQQKSTTKGYHPPSLQAPMSPPSPKSTKLIVEQPLTAFLHQQKGGSGHPPPHHVSTRRDVR